MCVIIDRKPKVDIPFEKLERACDINKHGYGIAFADRGRLEMMWSIKQPNDPDEVMKKLEELKKYRVFLHLRHATVGGVTQENQHPFISLVNPRGKKPIIGFMHNGTLFSYTPKEDKKGLSDTWLFNEQLLKPLFHRTRKVVGEKQVLHDDFVKWLLCREVGVNSKMVFFDAFGGSLYLNKSSGKEFDGWWASNEYSFDDNHSRSSAKTVRGTSWYPPYHHNHNTSLNDPVDDLPWKEDYTGNTNEVEQWMNSWEQELKEHDKKNLPVVSPPIPGKSNKKDDKRQQYELLRLGTKISRNQSIPSSKSIYIMQNGAIPVIRSEKVERRSFVDIANLKNLDQVGLLSEQDLIEMSCNWPQATAYLVIDLLAERLKDRKTTREAGLDLSQQDDKIKQLEGRIQRQAEYITQIRKDFETVAGHKYVG